MVSVKFDPSDGLKSITHTRARSGHQYDIDDLRQQRYPVLSAVSL